MPHLKKNTVNCRIGKTEKEFLNRLGGGTEKYGKQELGLRRLLERYFQTIPEDYEISFDIEELDTVEETELFKDLPPEDQARVLIFKDALTYARCKDD